MQTTQAAKVWKMANYFIERIKSQKVQAFIGKPFQKKELFKNFKSKSYRKNSSLF